MKKLFAFLLFFSLVASSAYAADVKIGVIDLQRAISSCKFGQQTRTALEAEMKSTKDKIAKKYEELDKKTNEYRNQLGTISDDARAAKEKELQKMSRDAQLFEEDRKNEFVALQNKMGKKLVQTLGTIAEEVAKKEGYDFVFERINLLYFNDAADLTDKLIAEADARFAKKK